MAVPDYQSVMLPLLRFAGEKDGETSTGEAIEVLAKEFGLTDEDLKEMLPSGIQSTFVNKSGLGVYLHEESRSTGSYTKGLL